MINRLLPCVSGEFGVSHGCIPALVNKCIGMIRYTGPSMEVIETIHCACLRVSRQVNIWGSLAIGSRGPVALFQVCGDHRLIDQWQAKETPKRRSGRSPRRALKPPWRSLRPILLRHWAGLDSWGFLKMGDSNSMDFNTKMVYNFG